MAYRSNEVKEVENKVAKAVALGVDAVTEKACAASEYIQERASEIQEVGKDSYADLEKRIKKSPGQSVAIAFAAGLLASFLMGRR